MAQRTDIFALGRLGLTSGEGRRLELHTALPPLDLGGERYTPEPELVPVQLDISRTTGNGFALRLRFSARLTGPCMRCLGAAAPCFDIDAREVNQPGVGDEELRSPYVDADDDLDLAAWARDAFALAVPAQITCTPECRGLCPACGANLNDDPEHAHEPDPDPRWSKLSEIRFE
jgi:uncharacterized protein